jgi:putative ABC transport system permease protein
MTIREWWSKLRGSTHGLDDELAEEMRSHIDLLKTEYLERGMSPEEAEAAARRHFGNATLTRERAKEAWQFPALETVWQDLRVGFRGIRKSPSFAAVVILTLALGIGATTAIFSVVYSVLLRPLPYPSGERLVVLGESSAKADGISVTWVNYQHWRKESRKFEEMAGYHTANFVMTGRGDALLLHAGVVTSQYFGLTGMRPLMGRLFDESVDRPGSRPSVVLAYDFWAQRLGADPNIVGSLLNLSGEGYQTIGVLGPERESLQKLDCYIPLFPELGPAALDRASHGSMRLLARLKPGVSLRDAQADLDAIMRRLEAEDPGRETGHRSSGKYLAESITGDVSQTLWILLAAVGLLLLVACANVASLLLVRSSARTREIAIRSSIGAGRLRLARQLLTENLLLAGVGGGLGLLLAQVCLQGLVRWGPDLPRLSEIRLDVPVLVFGATATWLSGLLAGLAPVLTAGRLDVANALKEGSAVAGSGRGGHLLRGALVIAEVALTLVLAFASALLLRSLIAAETADPGFDPSHLLALELQLPSSTYKSTEAIAQFHTSLTRELHAQPGVVSVGAVECPPSAGDCEDWWYSIVGKPVPTRSDVPLTLMNWVDTAYFDTLRQPLLAGRGFADTDRTGAPGVVVVNQELARTWWPSPAAAVGNEIKLGGPYLDGPLLRIVGVVRSVSQMGMDEKPLPEIYFPFSQRASRGMVVMIRTAQAPASLAPAVRKMVSNLDRNLPIQSLRPFEEWMGATLARRRFSTALLSAFASLAIILAAVGIYGVLNHWVGVRRKEIAVRLALGAPQSAIVRWAGAHALRLAAAGIVLGAAGAWAASRYLSSMVFGVSAADPVMLILAVGAVLCIAAMAAMLPLWRATRVDAVANLKDA